MQPDLPEDKRSETARRLPILAPVLALSAMACVMAGCASGPWNDPRAHNSDNFDLTGWKLTVPVSGPESDGKAAEVKQLAGYESRFFYDAPDGAMVFRAPVNGKTTKGSKYPRSELRERTNNTDAAWNIAQGGTMTASLKIDVIPKLADGTPGKVVIGQIHGEDDELIRLYWDNGAVYFKNDLSGPDNKEHLFELTDASGKTASVPMGQIFSYKIDAHGDTLEVHVYINGTDYVSISPINPIWATNTLYFKAGAYLGQNSKQGAKGIAEVSFYGLDYGHTPGSGLGGLSPAHSPLTAAS